jgi:hypothetical protein
MTFTIPCSYGTKLKNLKEAKTELKENTIPVSATYDPRGGGCVMLNIAEKNRERAIPILKKYFSRFYGSN